MKLEVVFHEYEEAKLLTFDHHIYMITLKMCAVAG
jgi:hypothetical protein